MATFFPRRPIAAFLLLALVGGTAVRAESPGLSGFIVVEDGWARATPPGVSLGGGFLSIENQSGRDDRLVRIESPRAQMVELHETTQADGIVQMRPLDGGLPIRNGERITLAPGSLHLMFSGLSEPLRDGGTLPVILFFETAGRLETELAILPIGSPGPSHSHAAGE